MAKEKSSCKRLVIAAGAVLILIAAAWYVVSREGSSPRERQVPDGLQKQDTLKTGGELQQKAVRLAAGTDHSVVVANDGTVWGWGLNSEGQIGNGERGNRKLKPVQAEGLSDVVAVSCGDHATVALKRDGTVWAWGNNISGQLGAEGEEPRAIPARVPGLDDIVALAGGYTHIVALKRDGTVWTWGANHYFQLDDDAGVKRRPAPMQVPRLYDVTAIAAGGGHSVALRSDGSVWTWGWNEHAQLGDGTTDHHAIPRVVRGISGVKAIASGDEHVLALGTDGTVWAWGINDHGEVGIPPDQENQIQRRPVQVPGLEGITAIASRRYHNIALDGDGTVLAWGEGSFGALGTGTPRDSPTPLKVPGVDSVTDIAAGPYHTLVLKRDGTVWSWGWNQHGQLGHGDLAKQSGPGMVPGFNCRTGGERGTTAVKGAGTPLIATQVAGGANHTLVLREDGSVWSWGWNEYGQLGIGTKENSPVPVRVPGMEYPVKLFAGGNCSSAVKQDGTVWTWGYLKETRQDTAAGPAPAAIAGLTGVTAISSENSGAVALDSDGRLWRWHDTLSPERLEDVNGVKMIEVGSDFTMLLKKDGTVWSWSMPHNGTNVYGQLGLPANSEVPARVPGLPVVAMMVSGRFHTLALAADGTVKAWGYNEFGQVGEGTFIKAVFAPVPVKGLKDVAALAACRAHSLALKKDGTVWAWGENGYGQLGDGTSENRNQPVAVKGLASAQAISCGDDHSIALKTDGTVWTWGYNFVGQLGDGTDVFKTTPVQVMLQ